MTTLIQLSVINLVPILHLCVENMQHTHYSINLAKCAGHKIQDRSHKPTRMHSSRMHTARGSSRPRGGLPQCMLGYTPPWGVGLETPHPQEICCKACWDHTCNACWDTSPPDLQGMLGYYPPPTGDLPARHAGIPLAMHAGIPTPPVNRITNTCKNITLPQLRCGR